MSNADDLNNWGSLLWQQGRVAEAEDYYRQALRLRPGDYAILSNLGNVLWAQGRPEEAIARYREVLRLCPESTETWINLGVALSDRGQLEDARECLEQALALAPDFPDAHQNLGMTLARLGRLDEALARYERALALRPDYPEARRNRALVWLARGDFARGWSEYEWRLQCWSGRLPDLGRPPWKGEPLGGQTILLHSEQGLGDTLQFIRYASAVRKRGGRVVAACQAPLVALLASCPGVDQVVPRESGPWPEFDVQAPLMSLPFLLGTMAAEVPYLSADAERVDRWRPTLDRVPGLRVGVVWQGNPQHPSDARRSFPLEQLAPVAAVPGVRLISLQHGEGREQLGHFPIEELESEGVTAPGDFLDSAAVMTQLDLLITVDSAPAHLAGALGVRTWVALPFAADWRWGIDREESPWYPSLRLFRQKTPGDWDNVFGGMAERLRAGIP